ncbi:hypothetical protein [Comamonas sp. NLF-1-9]|uniref:hypothetical protein n=1 Tax=Comamonas sp. NLF-1-9 TaxID=2853163 RepID=UPI001C494F8D|nr:hypothetical protein [Comamonas sp. NLF-1-9]QXL83905.1 hypothetical protein KUD94_11745 [Comamonas sp. NLF-1-9]
MANVRITSRCGALHDVRLEVLLIPSDLLDRLRKKGNSVDKRRGQVRFSSLQ